MTAAPRQPARPAPPMLWWLAARPKTLPLALTPVMVGTAVAWSETGGLDWTAAGAALLGAVLIQAGTNLHNDAGDFARGGDGLDRIGPARVTAMGWATYGQVRLAAVLCFAAAALAGLYLIWVGGWPILALGVASILAGWAYTGGPRPIAYTPLGEVFVFAFFGLGAVLGSHWVQTLEFSWTALAAACALGGPAAAVLAVNNTRDIDQDRRAGRLTLAVMLGRDWARYEYAALMAVPFAFLWPLSAQGVTLWLPVLLLPWAGWLGRRFWRLPDGPEFNALLAGTARFQLAFGTLLSVGVMAS